MFNVHRLVQLTFTEIFQHSYEFIFLYWRFSLPCLSVPQRAPSHLRLSIEKTVSAGTLTAWNNSSILTTLLSQRLSHAISLSQSAAVGSRDGVMRALKVLESAPVRWAGRGIAARLISVSLPPDVVGYWKDQSGDFLYLSYYQQIHKWTRANYVWVHLLILWFLYPVWGS